MLAPGRTSRAIINPITGETIVRPQLSSQWPRRSHVPTRPSALRARALQLAPDGADGGGGGGDSDGLLADGATLGDELEEETSDDASSAYHSFATGGARRQLAFASAARWLESSRERAPPDASTPRVGSLFAAATSRRAAREAARRLAELSLAVLPSQPSSAALTPTPTPALARAAPESGLAHGASPTQPAAAAARVAHGGDWQERLLALLASPAPAQTERVAPRARAAGESSDDDDGADSGGADGGGDSDGRDNDDDQGRSGWRRGTRRRDAPSASVHLGRMDAAMRSLAWAVDSTAGGGYSIALLAVRRWRTPLLLSLIHI